jgi:AraC family transcriptional regulator
VRHPPVARFTTLSIPGLTADYTRLPPGRGPSITAGHAIGVAVTPQRRAAWRVGRMQCRSGRLAPSTVFVTPAEGLDWDEWSDVSESIEMWLDPAWLGELSRLAGGPSQVTFDYHEEPADAVVVNVAAMVRRAMISGRHGVNGLESAPLLLARHVLERYRGLRLPRSGRIRKLDRAVLARVTEHIDANLQRPVSLLDLAGMAQLSPFHFAKTFKATTGSGPHAYLASRRMERALVLLQQSRLPVSHIARQVGFESLTHFRLSFRRAWGEPTSAYRRAGRPRKDE